jgi:hypothetical protein
MTVTAPAVGPRSRAVTRARIRPAILAATLCVAFLTDSYTVEALTMSTAVATAR